MARIVICPVNGCDKPLWLPDTDKCGPIGCACDRKKKIVDGLLGPMDESGDDLLRKIFGEQFRP